MNLKGHAFLFCLTMAVGWTTPGLAANTLFQEGFEDGNLAARGWYDNTTPVLSDLERVAQSTKSLQFRFPKGAVTPEKGGTMRKKFLETDSVYLSYYVKYSSNWVGSGVAYHPHEFYLLTNKDTAWTGPAFTRLTLYLEQNGGRPQVGIQDGVNVDKANIGKNLTTITENRSVAGCNGDSDGYGNGECYANGSNYWNGKMWKASSVLFSGTQGPYYKNDWHRVEVYIKLNSIVNGKGAKDGIMQYWFDGKSVMDYRNIVFRTALNSDIKFNQFIIGPYIGVGSPVDQTFWIDNLVVATGKDAQLTAPQNLRIIGQ